MAQRPVYIVRLAEPFYRCQVVEFVYNSGFAVVQKQKNIVALHGAYHRLAPDSKMLEISSKSLQPLGVKLSAFHLLKEVPSLGKRIPVENVFQGGKVFLQGGPFTELYAVTPKEAKRDPRLRESGRLTGFVYEGETFPTEPKTAFYDWIYIRALMENEELMRELVEYDAFTDIEFNPQKSINCQARAAAIAVSLYRAGRLDVTERFEDFVKLYGRR